jgi:type I restriction-modification system DNA methylase subunit
MSAVFQNERHERAYRAVIKCLRGIGYTRDLIQENYEFNDWFEADAPRRHICAAFGQTPFSYDSACVAVLPTASMPATPGVITNYRALGAPLAIEVREDGIVPWRIGRDEQTTHQFAGRIPLDAIEAAFKQREPEWNPETILRAKNIGRSIGPRQLTFIDLGLIPALEEEISQKLHELLNDAISEAQKIYRKRTGRQPDVQQLFRMVFRLLAGRVLHDRSVAGFRNLTAPIDPSVILAKVGDYYREKLPVLQDRAAQQAALDRLWTRFSFRNLSVDILAYIYENTLVDPKTREELGIHSTPRSIARYIVNQLPFENIPCDDRIVVEPCSGHGVFLVAALKRLRDLLPANMDGQERHRYFVKMLRGFEIDPFALEVSRLCLTLADFPNQNGWKLNLADVFQSETFNQTLKQARVVICNPPFQDFKKSATHRDHGLVKKPVAVLEQVLSHFSSAGILGFVLPRQFISGLSYRKIRQALAKRYDEIEIINLPDRVFSKVDLETCLLLGRKVRTNTTQLSVQFAEVKENDRQRFLQQHAVTRRDAGRKTIAEAVEALSIPALDEVWKHLQNFPKLASVAEIHRGVEWQQPFDEKAYLSFTPKPSFVRGTNSAQREFGYFRLPKPIYLNAKQEYRRGGAWTLPWDGVKAVMNAVRVSRGAWCVCASPDFHGLVFSQSFHCFWPKKSWTANTISAVLNNPVAAAYIATREGKLHIRKMTLSNVPIPILSSEEIVTIDKLVESYRAVESGRREYELWNGNDGSSGLRNLLLQIDAVVLRAYNLPPRLERQLLDFFRNERRPVPFDFGNYFPNDFTPTIPLWRYVSPDFKQCSGQHLLEIIPKVTDPALVDVLEEVE